MRFADREVSRVFSTEYWWKKIKDKREDFEDATYDSELEEYTSEEHKKKE